MSTRLLAAAALLGLAGCGTDRQTPSAAPATEVAATDGDAAQMSFEVGTLSLVPGSDLATIAARLNAMEFSRSSAVQDALAAEAALRARRFDRFPQLIPTAAAPLTGGGSAAVGLNIEQMIWDAGRNRARLTDAELQVMEAHLIAWRERNQAVLDGLEAYIEIARSEARLNELAVLGEELNAIATLLQTRLEGGVADRGEVLRMTSAQQEIERRIVFDRAAQRRALTDFLRLLPDDEPLPETPDLDAAARQCARTWPDTEAPAEALARITLSRAEASADGVRARRFPQLILSAGTSYSEAGMADPVVGFRLDASDMLGLGRNGDIAAAEASEQAAEANYLRLRADIRAELVRLDADYEGLLQDVAVLRDLLVQNDETLTLFQEQLEAGSAPLTGAIDLQRERTDTLIALIDVQADIVLNCLQSSQLRGLLAPFGAEE